MTVEQLRNLDLRTIRQAERGELVAIVRTAGHQLNKRLSNLEGKRLTAYSPAYRGLAVAMGGGNQIRFREGGKTQDELFHMIVEMKNFARAATSNVRGASQYRKDVEAAMSQAETGEGEPNSEAVHRTIDEYWKMFKEFRKRFPQYDSGYLRKDFRRMFKSGKTLDEMIDHEEELIEKRELRQYEEEEELESEFWNRFFPMS